jgi:hypothetical protein
MIYSTASSASPDARDFAERGSPSSPQSALMLRARMTLPHVWVSSARSLAPGSPPLTTAGFFIALGGLAW